MPRDLLHRDRAMLAVAVLLDVAGHVNGPAFDGPTVSAADLARRLGQARRGMEPLLQALSRAGLLESLRGPHGGYRLGRDAEAITIADIVMAARAPDTPTDPPATVPPHHAVIDRLWDELEAAAMARLAALTLADLLRRAHHAGPHQPGSQPLNFAI